MLFPNIQNKIPYFQYLLNEANPNLESHDFFAIVYIITSAKIAYQMHE